MQPKETTRTCGTCNVCCVHVKVEAFDKPAGVPCQHLTVLQPEGCCGIYKDRPSECSRYRCGWLEGLLPDGLRPDRSGILMERATIDWPRRLDILMGFELRPGCMSDAVLDLIEESLPAGTVAGIVPHDKGEVTYIGEEEDLAVMAAWMRNVRKTGSITHNFADQTVIQELPKG